jgi:hypothetical protein
MAHAKAIYLGYEEERWQDNLFVQVRSHVDHVLAEINRLEGNPLLLIRW